MSFRVLGSIPKYLSADGALFPSEASRPRASILSVSGKGFASLFPLGSRLFGFFLKSLCGVSG